MNRAYPTAHPRFSRAQSLLLAGVLLACPGLEATLFVDATVTPTGGTFRYEFTIQNTGPDDYVLVSLVDGPLDDPLIPLSLTAPNGFLANYDPGLGTVDFLEDADLLAPAGS
jgi:uncharacterized repeat protein (TIGR01451 family)